jgi:hypothetical protein
VGGGKGRTWLSVPIAKRGDSMTGVPRTRRRRAGRHAAATPSSPQPQRANEDVKRRFCPSQASRTTSKPPRETNGAEHMSSATHTIGWLGSLDRKNGRCTLRHVSQKNGQDSHGLRARDASRLYFEGFLHSYHLQANGVLLSVFEYF